MEEKRMRFHELKRAIKNFSQMSLKSKLILITIVTERSKLNFTLKLSIKYFPVYFHSTMCPPSISNNLFLPSAIRDSIDGQY